MSKLILICLGGLFIFAFVFIYVSVGTDLQLEENQIDQHSYVEKIDLYYDIDNSEIMYTKDSLNNFIEVELNG